MFSSANIKQISGTLRSAGSIGLPFCLGKGCISSVSDKLVLTEHSDCWVGRLLRSHSHLLCLPLFYPTKNTLNYCQRMQSPQKAYIYMSQNAQIYLVLILGASWSEGRATFESHHHQLGWQKWIDTTDILMWQHPSVQLFVILLLYYGRRTHILIAIHIVLLLAL